MNLIQLQDINLYYSSKAFKETSFKSHLINLVGYKNKRNLNDIHALKNISIEVKPGDRLALIGHNGAGKSSLLKTIAGLYPISSGTRVVNGKVRSLFELTLGFEQEATGRENILYRGLLLGQTPKRMRELESDIVEFAEIGEFIDYPIKTYSSGMLVRLAFAISTAIPGDILLLDEVVGAGDLNFMAKAHERISHLVSNSELMVLSSHNFPALEELCNCAIVLRKGEIVFRGGVKEAVLHYQGMVEWQQRQRKRRSIL